MFLRSRAIQVALISFLVTSNAYADGGKVGVFFTQFNNNTLVTQKDNLSALGVMVGYDININKHFIISPEVNYFTHSTTTQTILLPDNSSLDASINDAVMFGVRLSIKDDNGIGFFITPSHGVIHYRIENQLGERLKTNKLEEWGLGAGMIFSLTNTSDLELKTEIYGDIKTISAGLTFKF